MLHNKLHIVSFNVPYPADYGGVIDVFNRIRALKKVGVEICLHTFTYGRPISEELQKYCVSVDYYRRYTGVRSALSRRPYIVESRDNKKLLADLMRDDAPILLEGLHCCAVLEAIRKMEKGTSKKRRIFVRAHNVEHKYYARLAAAEKDLFRHIYLSCETRRLQRYEPVLKMADAVFAVTEADAEHFRSIGCTNVVLMPTSHPYDTVVSKPQETIEPSAAYALYHADLSVTENVDVVRYLVHNIIPHCRNRFVIAGRNPSKAMAETLQRYANVQLVANPDERKMQDLIANAQMQILVTGSPTGLKLKLLYSLFAGRHCLVNSNMVAGTDLGRICNVADSVEEQIQTLDRLMETPFTTADIDKRIAMLGTIYSNAFNAQTLIAELG